MDVRPPRDLPRRDGRASVRIIWNPAAGARRLRDLEPTLRAADPLIEVHRTEAAGHAELLASRAVADGCEIIVAAGGDGTVNEVARGLLGSDAALGILPLGSGNGLARHLGISMDPVKAVERLGRAGFAHIDVGYINDRAFVCTAGIGFDAHVSRNFAASKRRGFASYFLTALRCYSGFRAENITARIGPVALEGRCYLLAFANASQYGNNAFIAPHADLSDGVLDVCVIDQLPPGRALRVASALMRGSLPASGAVVYHTATEAVIDAAKPIEYHVDGEFAGEARQFHVAVAHHALKIAL